MEFWCKAGYNAHGYQKISLELRKKGYAWATERCIRKLYKDLGLKGETPVFKTTRPSKVKYGKYPYLLKHKTIRYVNQVWATDITYLKMPWGMMYFTAVIDIYSRKILSWELSDNMKPEFCLHVVRKAIAKYGVPSIFNTDQGSTYTCKEFIKLLEENSIQISMDGVGRCRDNIYVERTWRTLKYEWVFLRDYYSVEQLNESLGEFVTFFNSMRLHQGLGNMTPDEVYNNGIFSTNEGKNTAA